MNAEMKVLQKKQNADFKILNLTDPQLVDPDWREDKAIRRELYDTVTYENGEEKRVWAELYPGQFTWYGDRIRELEALGAKESSIIMHIPIYTYRDAIRAALKADIDPKSVSTAPGEQTGCWNEGYEDSFGVMLERICSYPRDNGFFEEILKYGNTKNLICGHDHVNNFSVVYRGVRFTYALKTDSGCYWDPRLSGGTVLSVDSNGKMSVDHCFYSTKE